MRKQKMVVNGAYHGRIQVAFTVTALCFLFLCESSIGVTPSIGTKLSPMPGSKSERLGYPFLPPALVERIASKKKKAFESSYKSDKSVARGWGLTNIGFFDIFNPSIVLADAAAKPCMEEIVVAVIDTGIDYTHPELIDSLWINPKESLNGKDNDADGYAGDVMGWDFVNDQPLAYDIHGHGTHISGIIAGHAANGMGLLGTCPRVAIMPLKYYDNSGIGFNNLQNTVKAIHYAIDHGAQIINYSGGGADPAPAERAAIEAARAKGILFVAAAGNDSHNNDFTHYFPASYELDNIIAVASVGKDDHFLPSSNYGPKSVHIAAPGLAIMSSLPSGKFGTMSGTSQATAFVTGAAAILASQLPKNAFDYKKIKRWLIDGAKPMAGNEKNNSLSGGTLSVAKSVRLEKEELSKPAISAVKEVAQQQPTKAGEIPSTLR